MITLKCIIFALVVIITTITTGCSGKKDTLKRDYSSPVSITRVDPAVLTDDETLWNRVDDAKKRKLYFNDRLTMEILDVEKSEASRDIKLTHRPEDTMGYVLEGSFIVTVYKDTKQINKGGVYIIPSNVLHSIIAASPKARVMNIYTPTREDLRPSPADTARFNDNDIKSFIYKWFGLLDEKAPAGSFHDFLSVQGLQMEYPGKKINSTEDFENMYKGQIMTLEWRTSKLEELNVSYRGKGEYTVNIALSVTEKAFYKSIVKKRFKESWLVIDSGESTPRIKQCIVQEVKQ